MSQWSRVKLYWVRASFIALIVCWLWLKATGRIEPGITKEGLSGALIGLVMAISIIRKTRKEKERLEQERRDEEKAQEVMHPKRSLRKSVRR